MRNGLNPGKNNPRLTAFKRHRIILPVYIPALEGYFTHSLDILQMAIESLWLTTGERASVSVISNGSAPPVVDYLRRTCDAGMIDQLIINASNRGKVDAVTSVARGAFEELITVSDSDVLFVPGWLQAVESLFMRFPECGFVSPSPNPVAAHSHTSATILGALMTSELGYGKVVSEHDLDRFAHSVGQPDWFKPEDRRVQMVVRRGGYTACVGGGHFVFTIRREIAEAIPREPSLLAVGNGGEWQWLDLPPDKHGAWKLSTPKAFAYHMGNTPEQWMRDELERCRGINAPANHSPILPTLRRRWSSRLPWAVRSRIAYRVQRLHRRVAQLTGLDHASTNHVRAGARTLRRSA